MSWEFDVLDFIQRFHCDALDLFFKSFTHLGDAGIIWIVLAAVLLIIPKTRKAGAYMALALIMDLLICNCLVKPLVARTRPFDIDTTIKLLISKPKDYSFPSGHTAASFASVTALYLAKEKKLCIASLVVAVLIAFSRLYLYVHFPTDVLGGIVFGIIAGVLGAYFCKFIASKLHLLPGDGEH